MGSFSRVDIENSESGQLYREQKGKLADVNPLRPPIIYRGKVENREAKR
ncbi:MAG: hypothetical protein OXK72_00045 [Gammaproteobacteria bacterium]|nr:hypothetical protein [Gammaproteobacteria bacterium]MDE0411898.1 hypothetical protein [Gammaproteobacteria bacterium]